MSDFVSLCCPCCGGKAVEKENEFYRCKSCDSIFYHYSEENRIKLVNAHSYLARYRFDDADDIYNELSEDALASNDTELYVTSEWGRLLAYFGIVFVKGFSGSEAVPTIVKYDRNIKSVTELEHYQNIMNSNASAKIKNEYKLMAENIDKTYKRISPELEKSPSYDVFICTKISSATEASPAAEGLSVDYRRASMLYDALTEKGIKVFYSERCCQGVEYDSQIFSALIRSKLLVVLSSRKDYLESAWVESEWRRWLSFISNGDKAKNSLILYIPDSSERVVLPSVLNKSRIQRFNEALAVIDHIKDTLGLNKPENKEEKSNINNAQDYVVLAKKLEEVQGKYDELAKNQLNEAFNNKSEACIKKSLDLKLLKHFSYSLNNDNKTASITNYDGEYENIAIPEYICAYDRLYLVTSIEEGAFEDCKKLEAVAIPGSVIRIGKDAFSKCCNLKSIEIKNGVREIGEFAFSLCTSLEGIELPESVTIIGDGAFSGCESLKYVDFSGELKIISSFVFSDCTSLEYLSLPDSVININYAAFSGCSSLNNIYLSYNLRKIGTEAFKACTGIKEIAIPEKVIEIEASAFEGCSSLEEVEMPVAITEIGKLAFKNCSSLATITIPRAVKKMGASVFSGCSSLTINCELPSKPFSWKKWNPDKRPVNWSYKEN